MNDRWLKTAEQLLSLPTAPLAEDAVAAWVRDFAAARGLQAKTDRWGNVVVHYRRGKSAKRPLAFCAHMDHPGFIAENTGGDGLLAALWRGYVPRELFAGARVRFFSGGRWVRGRIERCQMHKHKTGRTRRVWVRTARPVAPGSVGMWDFPDPRVRGTRLYARGHDCVGAVAALCCALDELVRGRVETDVYLLFTRAEESGFLGAIGACKARTLPRRCVVISLETSRALATAPLGGGVVVRAGDDVTAFTPEVTAAVWRVARDLARRKRIRAQRKLMDGGTCESSVYIAYGYDSTGLCVPLGNYHNVDWDRMKLGPEYIDLNDFASLVMLLAELARRGWTPPGADFRDYCEGLFSEYGDGLR